MTAICLHAKYDPDSCSGELKQAYGDLPLFRCEAHEKAVMDEWAMDAMGFQRWFDRLPEPALNKYFGLTRVPPS